MEQFKRHLGIFCLGLSTVALWALLIGVVVSVILALGAVINYFFPSVEGFSIAMVTIAICFMIYCIGEVVS